MKSITILSKLKNLFLDHSKFNKNITKIYQEKTYLDAYSEHTDMRVDEDPHLAIGGMWEEIGKLQFDFFIKKGLQLHHTLLDIGCGTLRGGRHFIRYLNTKKYFGFDISDKAIAFGKMLVEKEGLIEKKPVLFFSQNKDLKFTEFQNLTFDFLLAQSVFTHLLPENIKECFQNVGRIMHSDTIFFFTFNEAKSYKQTGLKDFRYPFSFFESLAENNHFNLCSHVDDYPHPKGQKMLSISKKEP